MERRRRFRLSVLGAVACIGFAWTAWGPPAPAATAGDSVQVTSAEWKAERSQLRVEGTAEKPDAVVLVRDADTMKLIGSAAVRADGKWMLKVRTPKWVPCRARVELDGRAVECAVKNAPAPR